LQAAEPAVAVWRRWELRSGLNNRFRVFHKVDGASQEVRVPATGIKDRNRLVVGGEEWYA